jgi:ferredoxin
MAWVSRNVFYSTDDRSQTMRVRVDYDLCEGNAVCAGLVPEVFEVDDDDNLFILTDGVPAGLADQVRHAVMSCPKTALSLEDEAGQPIEA